MGVNADTGLNVEKFQQELTRTANRLSRACELAIEQFDEVCGASRRSMQASFATKQQRMLEWCNQAAVDLQTEKDTVLRNLTVCGQAEICSLVELARRLHDELQLFATETTTDIRIRLQDALENLVVSLSAAEVALTELRTRVDARGARFAFRGAEQMTGTTMGVAEAESTVSAVVGESEVAASEIEESIGSELADSSQKRDELLTMLRDAIDRQRQVLQNPVSSELLSQIAVPDASVLDNLEKGWMAENQSMAEVVRDLHEGTMAELLQTTRLEAEQLAFSYESKVLSVCGQLVRARRDAEDEYLAKVKQILERTEELISTEQFAVQLSTAEMGDRVENETFKEMIQFYSTIKAEAATAAHGAGRSMMDDFNTRVYARLNQLEAKKRELCVQLELLSKEFVERLEVQAKDLDVELQSLRLEIEVLEQETNSWISAVSFYAASIGKVDSSREE